MSEPYVTVLREIHDNPDQFALLVIASWCGKSADEIERLTAEVEAERWHARNETEAHKMTLNREELLQTRVEALEGEHTEIMSALKRSRMDHGLCKPIERNACAACAATRKLDQLLSEWKGPKIVLSATEPGESDV